MTPNPPAAPFPPAPAPAAGPPDHWSKKLHSIIPSLPPPPVPPVAPPPPLAPSLAPQSLNVAQN